METTTTEDAVRGESKAAAPTGLLLHAAMVLSGVGTTLLGPILPLLIAHWHLRDSQAGMLLTAEFVGLFLGGITISRRLTWSLLFGIFATCAGFGGIASAVGHQNGFAIGCLCLWIAGLGLGQLMTSANLLAGARYHSRRGSALSLLNFSWSFGAVLSPVLTSWLTPRFSLSALLGVFATAFLLLGIECGRQFANSAGRPPLIQSVSPDADTRGISGSIFLYFAAFFFLYGGIESSLNGWLATYSVRYGRQGLSVSELSTVLFWIALTSGRALASLLLLHIPERALRIASLAVVVVVTAVLIFAHTLVGISICAVLLGLSLAPCFPTTLSLLLDWKPRPRQAAIALAVTALGGAALNWLMGQVSTRSGSLQVALLLPLGAGVALLALSIASSGAASGAAQPLNHSRRE